MNRYVVTKAITRLFGCLPFVTGGVRRTTDNITVFVGDKKDCEIVARELNTAYRDGKFAHETGSDETVNEGM